MRYNRITCDESTDRVTLLANRARVLMREVSHSLCRHHTDTRTRILFSARRPLPRTPGCVMFTKLHHVTLFVS